jgi:hypothetical protein
MQAVLYCDYFIYSKNGRYSFSNSKNLIFNSSEALIVVIGVPPIMITLLNLNDSGKYVLGPRRFFCYLLQIFVIASGRHI